MVVEAFVPQGKLVGHNFVVEDELELEGQVVEELEHVVVVVASEVDYDTIVVPMQNQVVVFRKCVLDQDLAEFVYVHAQHGPRTNNYDQDQDDQFVVLEEQ